MAKLLYKPALLVFKLINSFFLAIQIDIRGVVKSVAQLPWYIHDLTRFLKSANLNEWPVIIHPCLLDKKSPAAKLGEYFWQDLIVARDVIMRAPRVHIDVGSRIDGFVAHVACFRPVRVLDVRSMPNTIPNVEFIQTDITNLQNVDNNLRHGADCVTCLHTLEHIGLGRYGDTIDPEGWRRGLSALAQLVNQDGVLWLSVPVGKQRVEFNAHRVFNPFGVVDQAQKHGLVLMRFIYIANDVVYELTDTDESLNACADLQYALGIFCFEKRCARN